MPLRQLGNGRWFPGTELPLPSNNGFSPQVTKILANVFHELYLDIYRGTRNDWAPHIKPQFLENFASPFFTFTFSSTLEMSNAIQASSTHNFLRLAIDIILYYLVFRLFKWLWSPYLFPRFRHIPGPPSGSWFKGTWVDSTVEACYNSYIYLSICRKSRPIIQRKGATISPGNRRSFRWYGQGLRILWC